MVYKFGIPDGYEQFEGQEYFYGDVFEHEIYPEWSRVTIGANEKQIPLMLDIAQRWKGPFGVLYVLKVSRCGHEIGRYQSTELGSFDDLVLFAYTFQEFFEEDGRHHVWFIDIPTDNRVIYDNHDLIYSYGEDADVVALLKARGFAESRLEIPAPHLHKYNVEYDGAGDEIMRYFEWKRFPLQEAHDDP